MSNFDPNAILRGAQLTIVGAYRALQNPALFKSEHYRQAVIAIAVGIAIRIIVATPVFMIRFFLGIIGLVMDMSGAQKALLGLQFAEESVLQIPFFLMQLMRYFTPALDDMFMQSLDWVDRTYMTKHSAEDPNTLRGLYYPNLTTYRTAPSTAGKKNPAIPFLQRYIRRAGISLLVYILSFAPFVGRFVLPAASFYSFNDAVGTGPAAVVFGVGLFLPRRWLVYFLQSYFASRGIMRELLEPYFSRIKFTSEQKRRWFRDREGLLFGFGFGFYLLIKMPLVGVLVYGIAEASTAYLITKVTDPVPPARRFTPEFAESQVTWRNKHEFMKLELGTLDRLNIKNLKDGVRPNLTPSLSHSSSMYGLNGNGRGNGTPPVGNGLNGKTLNGGSPVGNGLNIKNLDTAMTSSSEVIADPPVYRASAPEVETSPPEYRVSPEEMAIPQDVKPSLQELGTGPQESGVTDGL